MKQADGTSVLAVSFSLVSVLSVALLGWSNTINRQALRNDIESSIKAVSFIIHKQTIENNQLKAYIINQEALIKQMLQDDKDNADKRFNRALSEWDERELYIRKEMERRENFIQRKLSETEEQLSLINNTLTSENLVEKAKHYLDTQVLVSIKMPKGIEPLNGGGSGTLLANNHVLTAWHVVSDTSKGGTISVAVPHIKEPVNAVLIAKNEAKDLALLKVEYKELLPFVLIMPKQQLIDLPLLTPLAAVGYPVLEGPFYTHGELVFKGSDKWIINAPIFFGSSGGGVFELKSGLLIGIPVAIQLFGGNPIQFKGYIVPALDVLNWFERDRIQLVP